MDYFNTIFQLHMLHTTVNELNRRQTKYMSGILRS